jgi:hypothetical protein
MFSAHVIPMSKDFITIDKRWCKVINFFECALFFYLDKHLGITQVMNSHKLGM